MKTYRPLALLLCLILLLPFALSGCGKDPGKGTGSQTTDTHETSGADDAHVSIEYGLTKEEVCADADVAAWLESCSAVGRTIFDFYVFADYDEAGNAYTYLIYFEVPEGQVGIRASVYENSRGYLIPKVEYTTDTSVPCEYDLTRVTLRDCEKEPQTITIFLDGVQADPLITWR